MIESGHIYYHTWLKQLKTHCFHYCGCIYILYYHVIENSFSQFIGATAVKGSKFGKPDRAIHYSIVLCNGNEQTLTNCKKITHSLKEGRTIYQDAQTAGVKCLSSRQVYGDLLMMLVGIH